MVLVLVLCHATYALICRQRGSTLKSSGAAGDYRKIRELVGELGTGTCCLMLAVEEENGRRRSGTRRG
jgi:hypothetical protein